MSRISSILSKAAASSPTRLKRSNIQKPPRFGYASAEKEAQEEPNFLVDGFLDHNNVIEDVLSSSKFIFLGPKGSGKSSIGHHILLKYGNRYNYFVDFLFLQDFPYTAFSRLNPDAGSPDERLPDTWAYLLLLLVIRSVSKDESLHHPMKAEFQRSVNFLKQLGLLDNADLKAVVNNSASGGSFNLSIPGVIDATASKNANSNPNFSMFVQNLKSLIAGVRTNTDHFIIIDGLDDILTQEVIQYKSIGSLIFEVSRLNQFLSQSGVNVKIVLLCRTDIFERVDGPNKNKIRQDFAHSLNWYDNTRVVKESDLYGLVSLRAAIALGTTSDVFDEFFLEKYSNRNPVDLILLNTRYNPRDMIQALNYIFADFKGGKLSRDTVLNGLRNYSIEYFCPEMIDELTGYLPGDTPSRVIKGFANLGLSSFSFNEYKEFSKNSFGLSEDDALKICNILYDCGAISNAWEDRTVRGGIKHSSKYRSPFTSFVPSKNITLHTGLLKGLNLM